MQQLSIKITGLAPLLMHDNKMADPLNDYAKTVKPISSKRNKTDKDHEIIGRIEWEAGLYLHNGIVQLPLRVLNACFLKGAKRTRLGPKYSASVFMTQDYYPLEYKGIKIKTNGNKAIPDPALDKFYKHHSYRAMVNVRGSAVPRVRPIFEDWRVEQVTLMYNEEDINREALLGLLQDAGAYIGIGNLRPAWGRFEVEEILNRI